MPRQALNLCTAVPEKQLVVSVCCMLTQLVAPLTSATSDSRLCTESRVRGHGECHHKFLIFSQHLFYFQHTHLLSCSVHTSSNGHSNALLWLPLRTSELSLCTANSFYLSFTSKNIEFLITLAVFHLCIQVETFYQQGTLYVFFPKFCCYSCLLARMKFAKNIVISQMGHF